MLPPMGWNSWNSGIPLTEQTVKQTIDAMVSSGLRDAGYRYVNLDAGWAAATRDQNGKLQSDPTRFPHGITALADYAHDRNMYLGIYHSPFNEGCGQDPRIGGAGHERVDAKTFADWVWTTSSTTGAGRTPRTNYRCATSPRCEMPCAQLAVTSSTALTRTVRTTRVLEPDTTGRRPPT